MAVTCPKSKSSALGQGPVLPLLLFLMVVATFLPCLRNGFVSLDDPSYVSQNPHVLKGLTCDGVQWAFGNLESSNWHPLTWLSHLLDGELFGVNPVGHHATNVLLHALNTVLAFLLLQLMTGARWRSFVVAALFGLHPLRVESVAWISERKDVLSVFFWMLTTWAYVRYTNDFKIPGKKYQKLYLLSLGFFTLGLLAKSMLVTLPFALLLLDFWPLNRFSKISLKQLLLEKVPFLILAAADSAVTFVAQATGGSVTPLDALSWSARIANAVVSYVRYLGKLAWPVNLSAVYVHPGHWPVETVTGAAIVLIIVTALALWKWRTMPYIAVGWFWYLGTLIPVIGLIQVGRQAIADRYTYIPCLGILIAIVWAAEKLTQGWRQRETIARVAVAAALAACVVMTVRTIGYWHDTRTLFTRAVDVTPRNWVATAYLAAEYQHDDQIGEAISMYQESLDFNPYRSDVRYKLATLLFQQKRFDESIAQFQKAVELDPADAEAHHGLGAALQDVGRLDEAIVQFNEVIRLTPNEADAYSNLGNCYGFRGRLDEAINCFEQAVKLNPKSARNHRELGVGLANKARWDEAIAQFQAALQLDPSDLQSKQLLAAAVQQKEKVTPSGKP